MLFVSSLELVQFSAKLTEINRIVSQSTPPGAFSPVSPRDSHPLPNIIIASTLLQSTFYLLVFARAFYTYLYLSTSSKNIVLMSFYK